MTKGKDQLKFAMKGYSSRKKTVVDRFTGVLGITTGGNQVVEIPGRASFVWVRLRTVANEVIQVFNDAVSPVYDLPVIVERDKNQPSRYRIVGRDTERYSNWPSNSAYTVTHGNSHSFNRDDSGTSGDVVWVYSQQFLPFLVMPSGTYGAGNVLISPGIDSYEGDYTYVGNTGTADLLAYKPTGSTANLLLIYLDQETGNFGISEGGSIANTITGTAQIVANLPSPATGTVGLAGIRLVSGTSSIRWDNIYDVRPFFVASTSGGGGGGAPTDAEYVTMSLNGTLTDERVLTAGDDIDLDDGGASGNATISVPTGTFARPGHDHFHQRYLPILDDSVFKVTGTAISFDENLRVDVTGTIAYISMTGSVGGVSTPSTNELPAYDDNIFKVTGTAFVFNDNLNVIVTGTFAYVNASSTPGPAGDNTLLLYDNSTFKVTGTAISFGDKLSVFVTGTTAYVSITGSIGHVIQDDGSNEIQRSNLNFVGSGFEVYDDPGNDATVVSGTSSGGAGHTIQDDDESFAQRTNLKFIGSGFQVSDDAGNDATVVSGTHCGTYQRVGEATPLNGLTGLCWRVPDEIFASGSVAVFQNGLMQRVDYDYVEQFWVSGTYQYLSAPTTGTVHMVTYGVPCMVQYQPPTGTPTPPAGDALLLENGDYLLLETGDKILLE